MHAGSVAQETPPIPKLTVLVGDAFDHDLGIALSVSGQPSREAATRCWEHVHAQLAPLEGQVAPIDLRADVQFVELLLRNVVWRSGGGDPNARRLKLIASGGRPLGICMGPIAHHGVLVPRAGIGCGRVFVQKGNRSSFPIWCPECNKSGQRPKRALASLARWAEATEAWEATGGPGYARELWRLVELEQRRRRTRIPPIPDLTVLVGDEFSHDLGVALTGNRKASVDAATKCWAYIHSRLKPLEGQIAPLDLRADYQEVELYLRGVVWLSGGRDSDARSLKRAVSNGHPLGICMGPTVHDGLRAPRGGIGCGRVFVQKGNRAAFPIWCPECNKSGQDHASALQHMQRNLDYQLEISATAGGRPQATPQ